MNVLSATARNLEDTEPAAPRATKPGISRDFKIASSGGERRQKEKAPDVQILEPGYDARDDLTGLQI